MSNYVKATNFYAKDALLSGNPDKIIKGAEIDDEYNAIATAVASKADLNSPNFTGTPTVPTATAATNTTQAASTAFVTGAIGSLGTMKSQNADAVAITGGSVTGITDLLPADGGTGVSSLTAKSVIIGNGTSPVTFVAPSTSGNILTSNGTDWTSAAPAGTLGVSQTWQNVSGSRALGTSYQNTTGKPIVSNYSFTAGGPNSTVVGEVSTDNSTWVTVVTARPDNQDDINGGLISLIIPNSQYYRVRLSAGSTPSTLSWAELR